SVSRRRSYSDAARSASASRHASRCSKPAAVSRRASVRRRPIADHPNLTAFFAPPAPSASRHVLKGHCIPGGCGGFPCTGRGSVRMPPPRERPRIGGAVSCLGPSRDLSVAPREHPPAIDQLLPLRSGWWRRLLL